MNDAAKKWVEELRSGKWRQAREVLRRGDAFCCLGVANEISGIGHWVGSTYCEPETKDFDACQESEFASPQVVKWLGLVTPDGDLEYQTLAELNDAGKSFAEIADIIEQNAELLFIRASE